MASVGARPGSVADVLSGSSASASSAPAAPWGVPADFDVPAFIRSAKVHFIRLQAAWDARNLADIREFTTPEVYAEVKMQLDEERGANHHTEVVGLEAQLLGIEEGATDYLASVRFSGAMREDDSSSAEPFQEVWNLAKPKDGRSGWLLSGIQQLH
jgi:predicted lipid-binding transport protein (Tim44 family)